MIDSYLHKGLRKKLIEELKQKGNLDDNVLNALGKVPRHFFLESSFVNLAYKDKALPISAGQTISQPYTVAFQTSLLKVEQHQKILEVGTGSGYQTCVLMEMGARVYSIERQKELYTKALSDIAKLGYKPRLFYADGYKGLPTYGPFDRILVTAGASEIPPTLVEQLKCGGRMVIPLGNNSGQKMTLIEKDINNKLTITEHGDFIFVPLLNGLSS